MAVREDASALRSLLTANLNFGYGEPRSEPESLEFSGGLVIFMSELPPTGDVNTISLLEIVES